MKTTFRRLVVLSLLCVGVLASAARADEGIHASVDFLFLSPKISGAGLYNIFNYANPAIVSSNGYVGSQLEFAQRVTLGYEGDQGGGIQVRWFTFDNLIDYYGTEDRGAGTVDLYGDLRLDIDTIDVEFTQRGNFHVWDWRATAGVRYGRISLREDAVNDVDWEQFPEFAWVGESGVVFNGAGPTVSVLGIRPILWDGFSIFGGIRTSLLYGDVEQFRYYDGNYLNRDEFLQVWEIQAGFEMEREYDHFDLVLRAFWEAQRWDSDSNMLGDIGLHGFGIRTGIIY
ncbi:MAG: hypothetical protein GXP26_16175 [Planctomycetes bacterium]|nr:hypothetical protein [Planctomycetota bacterium]